MLECLVDRAEHGSSMKVADPRVTVRYSLRKTEEVGELMHSFLLLIPTKKLIPCILTTARSRPQALNRQHLRKTCGPSKCCAVRRSGREQTGVSRRRGPASWTRSYRCRVTRGRLDHTTTLCKVAETWFLRAPRYLCRRALLFRTSSPSPPPLNLRLGLVHCGLSSVRDTPTSHGDILNVGTVLHTRYERRRSLATSLASWRLDAPGSAWTEPILGWLASLLTLRHSDDTTNRNNRFVLSGHQCCGGSTT